jgi:sterol desaturase/sphingolipid hydroxylase (fatty acid hydroxylase superfamily)
MVDYLIDGILRGVSIPWSYFSSPEKRVFWVYLASSIVLLFYVKFRTPHLKLGYLFSKTYWFSASSIIDLKVFLLNGLVKGLLLYPMMISFLVMPQWIESTLLQHFGFMALHLTYFQIVLIYSVVAVVVSDFFAFLLHFLMHKVPFLWKFHRVHHSATRLTPLTQYRLHPIELILTNIRGAVVLGCLSGVFQYMSGGNIRAIEFLGINFLTFSFLIWGANLRHSEIPLRYFHFLEYILISPRQHQIHHSDSPKHYHANYGAKLAVWDLIFKSLVFSKETKELKFGLGTFQNEKYKTFWQNMLQPFLK